MNKTHDIISSILGSLGIVFSIQDVTDVLNLVLLIVSIINILLVATSKIITLYKDKKLNADTLKDVVDEVIDDIDEVLPNEKNN